MKNNYIPPSSSETKGFRPKSWMFFVGGIVIILLFLFAVAVPVTSNPTICGYCHSMEPAIRSWKKSSHAQITCDACHSKPGNYITFFREHLFLGAGHIFKEYDNNYKKPINADSELSQKKMTSAPCLRCHSPKGRRFTVTMGMTIDSTVHIKHLKQEIDCPVCHNRVAHKESKTAQVSKQKERHLDGLDMFEGCLRCHHAEQTYRSKLGQKAPAKCSACHNSDWKLKPDSHDDSTAWKDRGLHGMQAKNGSMSYCIECHASRAETGIKDCADCHGLRMPHPDNWRTIHRKEGKKVGRKVCVTCHRNASTTSCTGCHHERFAVGEPWVTSEPGRSRHPKAVRQEGAAACFACHKPLFCPRCHVRGVENFRNK